MHTLIWRLSGTMNGNIKVAQVILVRNGVDTGNPGESRAPSQPRISKERRRYQSIVLRLSHETLRLLDNAFRQSHGECDSRM
jgi:hypothetical protein